VYKHKILIAGLGFAMSFWGVFFALQPFFPEVERKVLGTAADRYNQEEARLSPEAEQELSQEIFALIATTPFPQTPEATEGMWSPTGKPAATGSGSNTSQNPGDDFITDEVVDRIREDFTQLPPPLPSLPQVLPNGKATQPIPSGRSTNRFSLKISSIGVDMPIVEGYDGKKALRLGAWHVPGTGDPLQGNNMVLTGHRYLRTQGTNTLYRLDEVKEGDEILITWNGREYRYVVASAVIVTPDRVDVMDATPQPQLTLITCHPKYSTAQRLVVSAVPSF